MVSAFAYQLPKKRFNYPKNKPEQNSKFENDPWENAREKPRLKARFLESRQMNESDILNWA